MAGRRARWALPGRRRGTGSVPDACTPAQVKRQDADQIAVRAAGLRIGTEGSAQPLYSTCSHLWLRAVAAGKHLAPVAALHARQRHALQQPGCGAGGAPRRTAASSRAALAQLAERGARHQRVFCQVVASRAAPRQRGGRRRRQQKSTVKQMRNDSLKAGRQARRHAQGVAAHGVYDRTGLAASRRWLTRQCSPSRYRRSVWSSSPCNAAHSCREKQCRRGPDSKTNLDR